MANGTKPLKKYTAGSISCALWESEANINGQMKTLLKATVERRYKDANGVWKSSNSFGRNEVPLVKWCLEQAFTAMLTERSTNDQVAEEVLVE
ncbi:MAG: hypothetical protein WCI73_12020 [Phycisphaerae bacterium]